MYQAYIDASNIHQCIKHTLTHRAYIEHYNAVCRIYPENVRQLHNIIVVKYTTLDNRTKEGKPTSKKSYFFSVIYKYLWSIVCLLLGHLLSGDKKTTLLFQGPRPYDLCHYECTKSHVNIGGISVSLYLYSDKFK